MTVKKGRPRKAKPALLHLAHHGRYRVQMTDRTIVPARWDAKRKVLISDPYAGRPAVAIPWEVVEGIQERGDHGENSELAKLWYSLDEITMAPPKPAPGAGWVHPIAAAAKKIARVS